jgi:hypothetical protein
VTHGKVLCGNAPSLLRARQVGVKAIVLSIRWLRVSSLGSVLQAGAAPRRVPSGPPMTRCNVDDEAKYTRLQEWLAQSQSP